MKRVLIWSLAIAGLVVAAAALAGGVMYSGAKTSTAGTLRFEQPLRIPPLLEARADSAGRKVFDLRMQAGTTELVPGKPAETWGVNGPHLGPTLRASRGDRVLMRVRNDLPETTTLHWHGMHLPAVADGGPHQTVAPGATWTPSWRIDQPAATLWYHPHQMGATEEHVYRGLAGMWIVEDPDSATLPLPREYGVDDIPLILQDKRLDDDGRLDFSQAAISPIGRLGDDMLVNGTYGPYLDVHDSLVRFRVLNASTARVYNVGFADDRRFALIATEAGLLGRPAAMTRLQLSPGERAEIVARFRPGESVVLRSVPPKLETDFFTDRFSGGDDTLDLLQIRAARQLDPSPELPERLPTPNVPDPQEATRTRKFELSGSTRINGRRMDMSRIDAVLEAGATEIWEVRNQGNTPHNFHPHGVSFAVLEWAGDEPPTHLRGPKDTVYVPPGETVRFVVRAPAYRDRDAPYMFHCHILEHEDRGMMGQFVVLDPERRRRGLQAGQ